MTKSGCLNCSKHLLCRAWTGVQKIVIRDGYPLTRDLSAEQLNQLARLLRDMCVAYEPEAQ